MVRECCRCEVAHLRFPDSFQHPRWLLRRLRRWLPVPRCGEVNQLKNSLKRLRAAGYYDTAIAYLDRLEEYPSVDPKITNAILLEKAQTFIDAAIGTRNPKTRDEYFRNAERELTEFLKQESHPRESEARLQLGKLQMVRAAQLMNGQPDQAKREAARQSYLAGARTFDRITEQLKTKLLDMQGAKIDPAKDPEAAALRINTAASTCRPSAVQGSPSTTLPVRFDHPPKKVRNAR